MHDANWMFSVDKGFGAHLHGIKSFVFPKVGLALLQNRVRLSQNFKCVIAVFTVEKLSSRARLRTLYAGRDR